MTPSTRALLDAAREGLGPDPAAAARVRAKLDALLAAPAAAAAAPASAAGTGVALKVAAAIALATVTAAIVIAVPTSRTTPTATPEPALIEVAAVEPPAIAVQSSVREPAAPPPIAKRIVHTVATAPVVSAQPTSEISLAREVELIDDAMAALRGGHATDALAAVAAYHRETSDHGQLTEEASAIEIEASCTLHLNVRDKLAAFDRTWPSSSQRARLTAACR